MFHLTRRLLASLPAASMLIGLFGQPTLLMLPPAITALLVFVRDRLIRRRIGLAIWPSDGFARHVLVDDLGWLLCITLASAPLFVLGDQLRLALIG